MGWLLENLLCIIRNRGSEEELGIWTDWVVHPHYQQPHLNVTSKESEFPLSHLFYAYGMYGFQRKFAPSSDSSLKGLCIKGVKSFIHFTQRPPTSQVLLHYDSTRKGIRHQSSNVMETFHKSSRAPPFVTVSMYSSTLATAFRRTKMGDRIVTSARRAPKPTEFTIRCGCLHLLF